MMSLPKGYKTPIFATFYGEDGKADYEVYRKFY